MTLGKSPNPEKLFKFSSSLGDKKQSAASPYRSLHDNIQRLFKDLFKDVGRRSIPPSIITVVMVLQKLEGLSDREAVDRFSFDVR